MLGFRYQCCHFVVVVEFTFAIFIMEDKITDSDIDNGSKQKLFAFC